MDQVSLSALIAARITAKREEDAAVAKRRDLDAMICARVAAGKTEGSVTERTDEWKITVTASVTRSTDTAGLQRDWQSLPPIVQAAFRWKSEVVLGELRKLDDDAAAVAARYITAKPASPSLDIKPV